MDKLAEAIDEIIKVTGKCSWSEADFTYAGSNTSKVDAAIAEVLNAVVNGKLVYLESTE